MLPIVFIMQIDLKQVFKLSRYEILLSYFMAEHDRLNDDISNLQDQFRYRRITTIDCLELILAMERLAVFDEFTHQVLHILKISGDDKDFDK